MLQNIVLPHTPHPSVREANKPAGVVTNTAPTSTISTNENTRITRRMLRPNSSPTTSGRLAPFLRKEIIPDK